MLKRLGIEWSELFPTTMLTIMSGAGIAALVKGILITAGVIVAVPVVATVMIVSYQPETNMGSPVYLSSQELFDAEVSEAISDLLGGQLKIDITEARLNQFLTAYIVEEIKPTYDRQCRKGVDDDSCVIIANIAGFNNITLNLNLAWIDLYDDRFVLSLAISDQNESIFGRRISMIARLHFTLVDNNEFVEFKFDRLQTGFLPIPIGFFSSLLAPILENNGIPISGDGETGLTYSLADLSIRIDKQKFIDSNIENEVLANYASLIVQENLLQLNIDGVDRDELDREILKEGGQIRLIVDQERLYTQTSVPLIPGSVELVIILVLQELIESGTFSIGDLFN